ncbi:MAG: glycine cleavage system protein GcvH [Bdellovibrionales bacterium]|nr:glycine cleavage system protein GcvH [Bdellovibrionales bacterium]
MNYPDHLRYTKDHEWAELVSESKVRVGITEHAQSSLGDIVYLELPKMGRELKANETFGVVESIKAVSDLLSPVSGKVIEVNSDLTSNPGRINGNPHLEWMLVIEAANAKEQFGTLMDSGAYSKFVKSL